jgi:hypothetical protein
MHVLNMHSRATSELTFFHVHSGQRFKTFGLSISSMQATANRKADFEILISSGSGCWPLLPYCTKHLHLLLCIEWLLGEHTHSLIQKLVLVSALFRKKLLLVADNFQRELLQDRGLSSPKPGDILTPGTCLQFHWAMFAHFVVKATRNVCESQPSSTVGEFCIIFHWLPICVIYIVST